MTCDDCRDQLDALARGRLAPGQQTAIEQHLLECESCRADLEATMALATPTASLPREITPPADLWPGVARRIRPSPWRWHTLAAAAVLALMAATSLATARLVRHREPDRVAMDGPAVVRLIDAQYAPRLQSLNALLAHERGTLAPETVATIERNLAVIDRALAESREALERDPANLDLRTLYRTTQAQRVAFLEQATRLAGAL
jgi:hypothetical protein